MELRRRFESRLASSQCVRGTTRLLTPWASRSTPLQWMSHQKIDRRWTCMEPIPLICYISLLSHHPDSKVINITRFNLIYIFPMFGFICKKLHFSRQIVKIVNLSLHRFVCRTNRYSNSKFETTLRLVSTPRIQWRSQNLETSFR